MIDLTPIYVTADTQDAGAGLRCTDHPEWWTDADGTAIPTVIRKATDHIRDDHRTHVVRCMCQGTRVIDQRCVPTTS